MPCQVGMSCRQSCVMSNPRRCTAQRYIRSSLSSGAAAGCRCAANGGSQSTFLGDAVLLKVVAESTPRLPCPDAYLQHMVRCAFRCICQFPTGKLAFFVSYIQCRRARRTAPLFHATCRAHGQGSCACGTETSPQSAAVARRRRRAWLRVGVIVSLQGTYRVSLQSDRLAC